MYFFGHEIIDLSNEMDMDLLDHPPQAGSGFLDLVQHWSRPGSQIFIQRNALNVV